MADFTSAVLSALGAPATPSNVKFLNAWMQAEGTKAAYNPLATTQPAQGATSFNSVGVRNYPSFNTGVQATVQTLLNGYYNPIVQGLRASANPVSLAQAVANSPWGTGSGVLRVLGAGGAIAPPTISAGNAPRTVTSTSQQQQGPDLFALFSKMNDLAGLPQPDWLKPYLAKRQARQSSTSSMSKTASKGARKLASAINPDFETRLNQLRQAVGDLAVTSGYRTVQEQRRLWNDAVKKYGSASAARKWVAPPGQSNHNKGVAADLKGNLDLAHQLAPQFGLRFPLGNEPWHIEMA